MDREIWQQLLSLESRDITQQWFTKIHGRKINDRRTREINAAAKQSREYFRNASNSNNTVRPLLTFYGVTSLSRSLLLLLKRDGGEEGLASGHGLRTIEWNVQLSHNSTIGLRSLGDLEIQTCSGLFSDFLKVTQNRMAMHVNSSAVDWKLNYDIPGVDIQISLGDLFARIPDLYKDYICVSSDIRYSMVNEMTFNSQNGFKAKVDSIHLDNFKATYQDMGYKIENQERWSILTCDVETFEHNLPLFINSYIQKTFGSIPGLYIAEPFHGKIYYSQLCITYLISFFLGMLVRYYPTQWVSLIQGDKGDVLWPTFNRAQQFVENSYPEIISEMINDILKEKRDAITERNTGSEIL